MKVVEKQRNSSMCFVCGMDNKDGIQAQFYSMEDKSVISLFSFKEKHQSFPGRVHGGVISSLLDELGLRAIWAYGKSDFGVTMDLSIKYRKPVPYDAPLIAVGKVTYCSTMFLKADAFLYNKEGRLLSEGVGTYRLLPLSKIAKGESEELIHQELKYYVEDDIKDIDISFIEGI